MAKDKMGLLTEYLRNTLEAQGQPLDTYDPDFIIASVMEFLHYTEQILTGSGLSSDPIDSKLLTTIKGLAGDYSNEATWQEDVAILREHAKYTDKLANSIEALHSGD